MVSIASGDGFGVLFIFFVLFTLGYPVLFTRHHVKHRFLFAYAVVFAGGVTVLSVACGTSVVLRLWEAVTSGDSSAVPVGLGALSLLLMLLAILAWVNCARAWRKARFFGAMERKWRRRLPSD